MKSTTNTTNRPGRNAQNALKGLLALLAAGALVSCGTHSVGTTEFDPPVANPAPRFMVQPGAPTKARMRAPEFSSSAGWVDRWLTDDEGDWNASSRPLVKATITF